MAYKRNIITRVFRKTKNFICRKRLKNSNFSIIAPTCIAGLIYHWLGKKFLSPTINMFMSESDMVKLANDFEWYMSQDLKYVRSESSSIEGEGNNYPVCILEDRDGNGYITLNFNHYESFEEAKAKWDERKQRINYDNLFFIFSTRDGQINYDDIKNLKNIKAKGIVCFTAKNYSNIDYALQLSAYKNKKHVGPYLQENFSKVFSRFSFEKDFDFVYWLNTGKVKK